MREVNQTERELTRLYEELSEAEERGDNYAIEAIIKEINFIERGL